MESIVPYAIWAAIILAGAGALLMVGFSVRSLTYGKVEPLSVAILAVPGALILILGLTMSSWAQAAMLTFLIMLVLTLLGLLISGVRSLFI